MATKYAKPVVRCKARCLDRRSSKIKRFTGSGTGSENHQEWAWQEETSRKLRLCLKSPERGSVQRRTKIKNHIRDLLLREGQVLPRHRSAWTQAGWPALEAMVKPYREVSMDELWRGELEVELVHAITAQL